MSLTALRKVAAETGEQDPSGGLRAFDCGLPPEPPPDATWGAVYCTGALRLLGLPCPCSLVTHWDTQDQA